MAIAENRPPLLLAWPFPDPVEARADAAYACRRAGAAPDWTPAGIAALADGMAGILTAPGRNLDATAIAALPETVRIVATFSVGTDHLDLKAAAARGIAVTNTPDVLTDATADITLLCLLGAARRATEGLIMVRENRWTGWTPTQLVGLEVTGKRLGIVGMGRIGQAVARRARAFEMEIHYHNRRRLPADLEQGAVFHEDPLDLAAACDFVSLNCPATPETVGLVNARFLAAMRPGGILVNTARGAIVEDAALIAALEAGHLAAAGLDVFDGEPNLAEAYRRLPNVFALPHLGSATLETRTAMGFRALDNLDAMLLQGREPPDRVA